MAAIDKTYIKTFKEYEEVLDWAKTVGDFELTFREFSWDPEQTGTHIVNLFDWIAYPNMTEKWWKTDFEQWMTYNPGKTEEDYPGHLLWTTPIELDEWLMLNCPLEQIQKRLSEQYDDDYRQAVKSGKICEYLEELKERYRKETEQYLKERLLTDKNKKKSDED